MDPVDALDEAAGPMNPLRGIDYFTKPIRELVKHPDFTEAAFDNVLKLSKMTSEDLAKMEL
jgi:hypothetical protein